MSAVFIKLNCFYSAPFCCSVFISVRKIAAGYLYPQDLYPELMSMTT